MVNVIPLFMALLVASVIGLLGFTFFFAPLSCSINYQEDMIDIAFDKEVVWPANETLTCRYTEYISDRMRWL